MTKNMRQILPLPQSQRIRGQLLICPTKQTESAGNASECPMPSAGKTPTTVELVQPKPVYLIDGLSILDKHLGCPAWFWPVVMGLLFGVLPLLASYLENV